MTTASRQRTTSNAVSLVKAFLEVAGVIAVITVLYLIGVHLLRPAPAALPETSPPAVAPAAPKPSLGDLLPELDHFGRDLRVGDTVDVLVFKGPLTNPKQQIASRWRATLTGVVENEEESRYEVEYPNGIRQMVPPSFLGLVRHATH